MAIGERIHFFRSKRGMTQKYVGTQIGFDEKSADVRKIVFQRITLFRQWQSFLTLNLMP